VACVLGVLMLPALVTATDLSGHAPLVVDFGIRGGAATNSYQLQRACCGAGAVLGGVSTFNAEKLHGTLGPVVGVLINDRMEVRFEAVHRRFAYQIQSDMGHFPPVTQHTVQTTRGHSWEFPLLVDYRPGEGSTRPFIGGGIDLSG